MTAYTATINTYIEHPDGSEWPVELKVRVIDEPQTRWEPGCSEVEPICLHIDNVEACLIDHAALVDEMIENERIEPMEDYR